MSVHHYCPQEPSRVANIGEGRGRIGGGRWAYRQFGGSPTGVGFSELCAYDWPLDETVPLTAAFASD